MVGSFLAGAPFLGMLGLCDLDPVVDCFFWVSSCCLWVNLPPLTYFLGGGGWIGRDTDVSGEAADSVGPVTVGEFFCFLEGHLLAASFSAFFSASWWAFLSQS